jgi:hypothetical protein
MTTFPPTTISPQTDFADWFSPILVKELRQGLKTRVFVSTFIIIQAVMIIIMGLELIALANGSDRSTMSNFDGFFWSFIYIPLLFLMPMRGLTAVSDESKANTLDLVQLTRLTAFRIVMGKWTALIAQTLLLVAAVLPYAVLRYFFGEVDIVSDVKSIAVLLSISLVLTAATVALSTAHLAVRILTMIGILFMILFSGVFMASRAFGGRSSGPSTDFLNEWWFHLIVLPLNIFMILEIAASRIAPLSENHAARKRGLALILGLFLPVCAAMKWDDLGNAWFLSFAPLWTWIVVEALCERTTEVSSLYAPFAKRGLLGRLAGRVLYPGWASAVFFTICLVSCGILAAEIRIKGMPTSESFHGLILFSLLTTAILFPLIVLLMLPRAKQRMWLYLLAQAFMVLIFTIAGIAASFPGGERLTNYLWLAPLPTASFLAFINKSNEAELIATYQRIALPVCALLLAYLIVRALIEFKTISKLENQTLS